MQMDTGRLFTMSSAQCEIQSTTAPSMVWLLLFALLWISLLRTHHVLYYAKLWLEYVVYRVPMIEVEMTPAERYDHGVTTKPSKSIAIQTEPGLIQCYDPATKQFLGSMPAMNASQVHELCVKAAAAQKEWRETSFSQRRLVLRTLQKYICAHVKDLCRVSSRDSGKAQIDALLGEVLTTCAKIQTLLSEGELWLQRSYRPTGPMLVHKKAYVEYVPMGVIATIAPWNYPFHNFINHILSGIFAGNAVIGKVSEHTSWSADYFGRIVRQALLAHGHNPDLCATVTGYGDAGSALVADPLVDKVVFTGSPAIGRKVMSTAADHLKPVILELGGKDAMVIMEDCKVEAVVPWVMRGCFQNCGQNCVGIERVMVYESLYDEFVDAVAKKVRALRQGIPLETCGSDANVDCGAMVMDSQMDLIQELVDDALKKGAKLVCGGKRNKKLEGQFYEPTIVVDVTPDMRLFQEEVFGPVMTIVKVPKDDDAECLKLVNQSQFGLGSSVYCGNQSRGLALGQQFRSGMLCINDFGSNYLVQSLPFGGVNESGFGRFGGKEGLRALCLERSILLDRFPGVRTSIPAAVDYPIDKARGFAFADALLQLFYNESIIAKVKGIVDLIRYG